MRFLRREAMTGALGVLSALAISHGSATAQTPLAIERDPPIATQPVAPAPILVPQAQGVPIPAAPPVAAKPLVVPPGPAPVAVPPPIAPDPVFTPKAPLPTASSSPVAPPTTPAEKPATTETPPAPAPTAAPEAAPSAPAPATTPAPAETAPAPTAPAPAAPAEAPAAPAPTPAVPPAPPAAAPPAPPPATPPAPPAAAPAPVPAVPAPVAPGPAEPAPVAPRASTGPAVEDVTVAPRTVLFITGVTTWERAEEQMGEVFGRLAKAAAKLGVKDPGGPLVEYIESDTDDVGFRAMLPIGSTPKGKLPKGIKLGQSPSGHALKFRHDGPIDDLEEVYGRIDDEVTKRGVDARSIVEEYDGDALASPEDRVVVDVWVFLK